MIIIKQTPLYAVLATSLLLWSPLSLAAGQQLKNISVNPAAAGKAELHLSFSAPVTVPQGFVMQNPPRLVFDFPDVEVTPSARRNTSRAGVINTVQAASNKGQARLVVSLDKLVGYTIESIGSDVVLVFDSEPNATGRQAATSTQGLKPEETYQWYSSGSQQGTPQHSKHVVPPKHPHTTAQLPELPLPAPLTRPAQPLPPRAPVQQPQALPPRAPQRSTQAPIAANSLRAVDFRREANGGARVIVMLPNDRIKVSDSKSANNLSLMLHDIDVPPNWQKNLDVVDFATPVTNIQINQRGAHGRINIIASEDFTYRTEKNANAYTIFIDKIPMALKDDPLAPKEKKEFSGNKLSLNFQDIEVRAVLQLLADFTNKNIVVSDTVAGNITVRLKDVPWDQALDIVLESKNLGMRENGNVIWVAPRAELDAKDALEIEMAKRKIELERLVTEYIPINFAKAADLAALIEKRSIGATSTPLAQSMNPLNSNSNSNSLLSPRGTVSFDERTNTLLVQDTASQVAKIRDLLKILDVPVQQVLIESRIVIANDEFGKELGARFGVTPKWSNSGSSGIGGRLGAGTDGYYNSVSTEGGSNARIPSLNDRLSVNLPIAGAAGSFGFSILASDFLLDLELSALQAESKGEIISTPRVITSDQTKALIQQGVEIPYQEASSSGATSVSFKKAVLSLEVTPQITPDEHISMDLRVNQDTVGQVYADVPSIDTRQVQTRVLVANGQTIVLGGIHEETNVNSSTRVPVLGDLPIIGQAFRKTNKKESKRELLIFVTPKIIDSTR